MRQLDALRAFAVLSVMIGHFSGNRLFFDLLGPLGVRLFFVLSGFLITQILLRERCRFEAGEPVGRIVRRFYLRRTLRIVPPFYAVLAVAWLAGIAVVHETLLWHGFYLSNFLVALTDTWYGATSHFWSLAVEEQFYLFWPWLILFCARRRLHALIVATIVLGPVFRIACVIAGVSPNAYTILPPGCLDTLGAGALLALYRDRSFRPGPFSARLELAGFRLGFPAFLLLVLTNELHRAGQLTLPVVQGVDLDAVLFALRDTAMAAWSVWLVGRAATGFTGAGRAVLEWAPLLYLGRISYAMYLIHNFMLLLPIPSNPADSLSTVSRMMILIAVDVALASLSWHVLEMPFDRLKQRLASVPPIIPPAASLAQAPPLRHQQAAATPSAA